MKKFKFTIHGNEYDVEIKRHERDIVKLEVNGTNYEVKIDQELPVSKTPTIVRKSINGKKPVKIEKTSGITQIKAPLPGNIILIKKKVGDEVKKGELVLMYEAMKMENKVLAEKDGVIANMLVNSGDCVLQGDLLFEID